MSGETDSKLGLCTQKTFENYRETVEARLSDLERRKVDEDSIPPGLLFALVGMTYAVFCVLARGQGVSNEDIQSYTFSGVVVSLVSILVCNYASIM